MKIRKSNFEDLPALMKIYDNARNFMKNSGNPNQWVDGYPSAHDISLDIEAGNHYTITTDDGKIIGAFMFRIGIDDTYAVIEGGDWLNDDPYGVIHRLASSGEYKGIADACFDYCFSKINNIRVDTHHENEVMQRGILRYGFIPCGTIYCHNGTTRLAFQKVVQ